MKVVLTLVVLGALGFFGTNWYREVSSAEEEAIPSTALYTAKRGDLEITVTENGYLKAKNSEKIKPKFKRSAMITSLIEEGEEVEEGDVLVEFDKTDLENRISELENSLIQYETELEAARADLEIQVRDNEALIEKAELAKEMKRLALERYEKGDAPNSRRKLVLAAEKAASEYERSQRRFEQVPELVAEGFLTPNQEEEERIRLREAEINKENAERDLELFDTYNHPMDLTQKKSDLKDAEREVVNATAKATINLNGKQARVTQKERQVENTENRLDEQREELGYMTITAPIPGIVHHGDPERYWYRDQIKIGNTVGSGMTLITLPDLREMQVLVDVHEADIDLVEEDMQVLVTVETAKGTTFEGKVTEIASVANSQSWTDSTNKTFRVEITMAETEHELRAGVTAKAEIQVEVLQDIVKLPLHAVVPQGTKHICFVYANGEIEQRDVVIGKNNANYVEVVEGLEEGEQVLLYDPREDGMTGGQMPEEGDESEDDSEDGLSGGMSGLGGAP